ncbi:MAG: hypothetical protein U0271_47745 [Polyangiaceae bacterium]
MSPKLTIILLVLFSTGCYPADRPVERLSNPWGGSSKEVDDEMSLVCGTDKQMRGEDDLQDAHFVLYCAEVLRGHDRWVPGLSESFEARRLEQSCQQIEQAIVDAGGNPPIERGAPNLRAFDEKGALRGSDAKQIAFHRLLGDAVSSSRNYVAENERRRKESMNVAIVIGAMLLSILVSLVLVIARHLRKRRATKFGRVAGAAL